MTGSGDAQQSMRVRGSSFALAATLLAEPQRTRVARLYAACRAVDDLADLAGDAASRVRLDSIHRQLEAAAPVDPVAVEFVNLARAVPFDLAPACRLIAGVRGDLDAVQIADEGELLAYAGAVAGTVGAMMAEVLGARSSPARSCAVDLGIAMQLTNIARDVAEDAHLGRRYLPYAWAPFRPDAIARASVGVRPACAAAVLRVLSLADRHYASGLAGLGYLPLRPRLAVSAAAAVYGEIGVMLREREGCFWEGRVVVPRRRRLAVAAAACRRALRSPARPYAADGGAPRAASRGAGLERGADHARA